MQFVKDGPDIPNTLLQAHEDGNVVFFCGAGISYPAGLMGFKGLVDSIYKNIDTDKDGLEQELYDRGQFDSMLGLLEKRMGQRKQIRKAMWQALKPNYNLPHAIDTHEAILKLARDKDNVLRIVTTNADRIFEHAAKKLNISINTFVAPMLPTPKKSRWDGIVYLHGQLSEDEAQSEFTRLVFTSGDFGLAYLDERWASRFVSELFKNYVICFIGYSINDPILRYMMDALAADRMQGEFIPEAYAFANYAPNKKDITQQEWEAKGVEPILYSVDPKEKDHSKLHETLWFWADTYAAGASGKESIVARYALSRPYQSTIEDNYVDRVIWALSDPSGLPAKRFAHFNPCPSLHWLECLSNKCFTKKDLPLFGISGEHTNFNDINFSLIERPTPAYEGEWRSIRQTDQKIENWDKIMHHLAYWMTRHLNNPKLVFWLTTYCGHLNPMFISLVENALNKYHRLEQENNQEELARIRQDSPYAIPDTPMKVLWRMLLTGRIIVPSSDLDVEHWIDRIKRDGLTPTLVMELRTLLTPKIQLHKPAKYGVDNEKNPAPYKWDLVLAKRNIQTHIKEITDILKQNDLGSLFNDFQLLLLDSLSLVKEMGNANEYKDRSYRDLPSISEHTKNKAYHDWTLLIELLRDAWLHILSRNKQQAQTKAIAWFDIPFPTFKRLAFFAASYDGVISPNIWCEWLCRENGWWLWSLNTRREVMRLLVLQGQHLDPNNIQQLEKTILAGLPRYMLKHNIVDANFQKINQHAILLYLATLVKSRATLSPETQIRYQKLCDENPQWLRDDDQDEFSLWLNNIGEPDFPQAQDLVSAPDNRKQLSKWLMNPRPYNVFDYEDNWKDLCKQNFDLAFWALNDLFVKNIFPIARWKTALWAWSEEKTVARSWVLVAPVLIKLDDDDFIDCIHAIASWLKTVSKQLKTHPVLFITLTQKILSLYGKNEDRMHCDEKITIPTAINNPMGVATTALFNYWFATDLTDNKTLQDNFRLVFTQICEEKSTKYNYGKLVLASHTIALFRVDPTWSKKILFPLFNWEKNIKTAAVMWQGFLWSPRIYLPLLEAIKSCFLETVNHLDLLDETSRQYAPFFTHIALEPNTIFSVAEIKNVLSSAPADTLENIAKTIKQAYESAADKKEEYWENRIHPLLKTTWIFNLNAKADKIIKSLIQ